METNGQKVANPFSSYLEEKQTGIIRIERICRLRTERKEERRKERQRKRKRKKERKKKGKKEKKKETKEKRSLRKNYRQHELRGFWLSPTRREKRKKKKEPVSAAFREVRYM